MERATVQKAYCIEKGVLSHKPPWISPAASTVQARRDATVRAAAGSGLAVGEWRLPDGDVLRASSRNPGVALRAFPVNAWRTGLPLARLAGSRAGKPAASV